MGKKDKKDKKKKKKEKKKKEKKEKKKKRDKKAKKKASSSSTSGSSSGSSGESSSGEAPAKKQKREKEQPDNGAEAPIIPAEPPKVNLEALPPVEEGIQRFIFEASETGKLGLSFSGGFPPMILAVHPQSFAAKKRIPVNFEVHAINGLPLVPQNRESVMEGLKSRPVALDVRPQGWKPPEKVKELERKREREEAERQAMVEREEKRREQVAREAAERAEREAAERAEREEQERKEREVLQARAMEKVAQAKAKREEFERAILADPEELRGAADELMKAEYGSMVKVQGRRGIPLRLLTRRKEVTWVWAGETQALIGGGKDDSDDTFS